MIVIVVVVVTIMAQVVVARCVRGGADAGFAVGFGTQGAAAFELDLSSMVVVKGCEAHGHELGEEEDEDGHEGDAFDPGILGDGTGQTFVREGFIGGGEEVDEGRGYDDTGTEVFGDEEGPSGYANAFMTFSVDGEQGACAMRDQRNGHRQVIPSKSAYRT